jgi:hypothetical protein
MHGVATETFGDSTPTSPSHPSALYKVSKVASLVSSEALVGENVAFRPFLVRVAAKLASQASAEALVEALVKAYVVCRRFLVRVETQVEEHLSTRQCSDTNHCSDLLVCNARMVGRGRRHNRKVRQ